MNKKPPLTPPIKGENLMTDDKMNDNTKYELPQSPPWERFRGALTISKK